MITSEELARLKFYTPDNIIFYRSLSRFGVILHKDGKVDIDNIADFEKHQICFSGICSVDELKQRFRELGHDLDVSV